MKAGVLKTRKQIKCVKCSTMIPTPGAEEAPGTDQPEPVKPETTSAVDNAKIPEAGTTAPVAPAEPETKAPETKTQAPAPEPPAPPPPPPEPEPPRANPEREKELTERLSLANTRITSLLAEVENLKPLQQELEKARKEILELEDRVSELQKMWHGKEHEAREQIDRRIAAEKEAEKAIKLKNHVLARIKNELNEYLMAERDSAIERFRALETRLHKLDQES